MEPGHLLRHLGEGAPPGTQRALLATCPHPTRVCGLNGFMFSQRKSPTARTSVSSARDQNPRRVLSWPRECPAPCWYFMTSPPGSLREDDPLPPSVAFFPWFCSGPTGPLGILPSDLRAPRCMCSSTWAEWCPLLPELPGMRGQHMGSLAGGFSCPSPGWGPPHS